MRALKSYAGPAGLIILAAGVGVMFFLPEQRLWGWICMSVGGVFTVAAAALNLEDLADLARGRAVRYGANAVFYVLIVLGIVLAVNFMASRYHKRFDMSAEGVHTLAPQTVHVLKSLDRDVELVAFYTDLNAQRQRFEDLAAEYGYHTNRLRVRVVDPLKSPGEARKLEIAQDGTVVVLADTGEARITELSEEQLTNALVKATRKSKKVVCFTSGHGEPSITDGNKDGYSGVADALRKENYEVKDVILLREAEVPAECSALIVGGPKTALLPAEAEAIARFLAGGGRLMVLKKDPPAETGLDELLARYGLKVARDVVVDRLSRAVVGDEFVPLVTSYEDHPVTKPFGENPVASFFPVASTVEATTPVEAGVTSKVIARTSRDAWGETGQVAQFDPNDTPGPIGLVAAASGPAAGAPDPNASADPNRPAVRERRVLLFGDGDFASNTYLHLSGNGDLFLNSVAWLAEESDLISVRPKENKPQPIALTAAGQNLLSAMTYLMPLAIVVLGVIIWVRRKRL